MKRIVLTYGLIAGLVVILTMISGIALGGTDSVMGSEWFGFLVMIIAFSLIFVGIKQYRDGELGGVIRFGPAFGLGVGIAAVAACVYVIAWETYLLASDYAFIDEYTASHIESKRAAGASEAELETAIGEMDRMKAQYLNPLIRLPITFLEIFPVGLLIALLAAAVLRNPRVLPARSTEP